MAPIADNLYLNQDVNEAKGGPIIFNSNFLTNEGFRTYFECMDEIRKCEQNKLQRGSSFLNTATKTREEIFEVSMVDEEEFRQALHDNNANTSSSIYNLDLSRSIENLLKYFDEDVKVNEDENVLRKEKITPSKMNTNELINNSSDHVSQNSAKFFAKKSSSPKYGKQIEKKPIEIKLVYNSSNKDSSVVMRNQKEGNSSRPNSLYEDYKKKFENSEEIINYRAMHRKSRISPRIQQIAQVFNQQFSPIKSAKFFANKQSKPVEEQKKISPATKEVQAKLNVRTKIPVPLPRIPNKSREIVVNDNKKPNDKNTKVQEINANKKENRIPSTEPELEMEKISSSSVKDKIMLFNKISENEVPLRLNRNAVIVKSTEPNPNRSQSKINSPKKSKITRSLVKERILQLNATISPIIEKQRMMQLNSSLPTTNQINSVKSKLKSVEKIKETLAGIEDVLKKLAQFKKQSENSPPPYGPINRINNSPTSVHEGENELQTSYNLNNDISRQNYQKQVKDLNSSLKDKLTPSEQPNLEYTSVSLGCILNETHQSDNSSIDISNSSNHNNSNQTEVWPGKLTRQFSSQPKLEVILECCSVPNILLPITDTSAKTELVDKLAKPVNNRRKFTKEELASALRFQNLTKRYNDDIDSNLFLSFEDGPRRKIRRKSEIYHGFANKRIFSFLYQRFLHKNKIQGSSESALSLMNESETQAPSEIKKKMKSVSKLKKPPENELQKSHDSTAALSEHQLRVQASLQRLNIPDWYRNYSQNKNETTTSTGYKPGNFSRKRASDSGRWVGLNSKTTSLSSLGSQRSDRSPLLLSPSAHSHHGASSVSGTAAGLPPSGNFSRWSTSYLNSTQTSPSVSQRGSFSRGGPVNSSFISVGGQSAIRSSFRQPYMGWRSQEKINQPRTPHERLASSILSTKPPKPEPSVTPEIQSSIKEVTSAIVHHFNDANRSSTRSRSTSPNSRKCWLESSFVGVRPLESPQTPTLENNSFATSAQQQLTSSYNNSNHNQNNSSDVFRINGVVPPITSLSIAPRPERSPSSASLEDVLASLLGLPSNEQNSYRSTSGDSASEIIMFRINTPAHSNKPPLPLPGKSNLKVDQQSRFRRSSEGDAQQRQKQQHPQQQQQQQVVFNTQQQVTDTHSSRRVSLDSSDSKTTSDLLVKCRNTKCDQSTNHIEAKKYFKSCHNCSHLYCSRECRRAHWEKHRKACLHSRVSNLCRQVLSSCKDDIDTLRHLSLLARKGYLSQGRGVVRILFRSPESAEGFIKNGFQCLGEASYVRWPDLMPAEMGLELYSELLRLSTEYKPESKMLIYVAICVVSEAPAAPGAAVKWERQLVSRCAKLKLCKSILSELATDQQLHQQMQDSAMEILILTFNSQRKTTPTQREIILQNIQCVLNRRGVILKKHYPEIYQRLQTFAEGQTERFVPVTLHPRDAQTGQGFVCIIMPTHNENELIRLPASEGGNKVSTIDVGEELLES